MTNVRRLAFVLEARVSRGHERFGEAGEFGDDVSCRAIAEAVLLLVARRFLEGRTAIDGFSSRVKLASWAVLPISNRSARELRPTRVAMVMALFEVPLARGHARAGRRGQSEDREGQRFSARSRGCVLQLPLRPSTLVLGLPPADCRALALRGDACPGCAAKKEVAMARASDVKSIQRVLVEQPRPMRTPGTTSFAWSPGKIRVAALVLLGAATPAAAGFVVSVPLEKWLCLFVASHSCQGPAHVVAGFG